MFLHIGGDDSVSFQDILSIHDYETFMKSSVNRTFMKRHEKKIVNLAGDDPKTLIVTRERLYLSVISTPTLKIRAEHVIQGSLIGKKTGIMVK